MRFPFVRLPSPAYAAALLGLVAFGVQFGCGLSPNISEYPPFIEMPTDLSSLAGIPVIVVGTILDVKKVGSPRPSHWGRASSVQLFKAEVNVENVLAGKTEKGRQTLFYFVDAGAWTGPSRLGLREQGGHWVRGDRELFFLQSDNGALRTICDNFSHCVVDILTGPHSEFQRHEDRWIGNDLADILLDPGLGCDDAQLARALERSGLEADEFAGNYALQKLEMVAAKRNGPVHDSACRVLSLLGDKFFGDKADVP